MAATDKSLCGIGPVEIGPVLSARELKPSETALFIIDMVNGFTREGPMKSERCAGIIPQVTETLRRFKAAGHTSVTAFCDAHQRSSPEFDRYPPHCLSGTGEAEPVDELKAEGGYVVMRKTCTNAALEEEFRAWHWENPEVSSFIVTGCCTDICVMQFAVTLKTQLTMNDCRCRVIVPVDAIATYDAPNHDGDLATAAALYFMEQAGVELREGICE